MTDDRVYATGGVIRTEDALPLFDGSSCTYYVWPDRMPSRDAIRFTVNLGEGADRIDARRLVDWINASLRTRRDGA